MFYNKEICIYNKQKIRDENGISRESYILVDTIPCDVQSVGKSSKKEEYGYTTENIKSIYADYNANIKIGNIVIYSKKKFKIDKDEKIVFSQVPSSGININENSTVIVNLN